MELNREQIIKALECCATKQFCAFDNKCAYGYMRGGNRQFSDALSLIKELTKELTKKETEYNELYELTTEEIKSLRNEYDQNDREWREIYADSQLKWEKALQYDRHQYEKGYKDGYDDGYDKRASEVASGIFEEIEEITEKNMYKSYLPNSCLWSRAYRGGEIVKDLAELKKKYTEDAK